MQNDARSVTLARDAYLAENGFTVDEYDARWTDASVLGIRIAVPNTPTHRWAIMRHDLHHVATGYGTDLAGEGEISAWELRRGLRGLGFYVGSIVLMGALAGALVAPRRALRAFQAAGKGRSLFRREEPYEDLLALDVPALRAHLGVPAEGLAQVRGLHTYAPRQATA